MPPPLPFCSSVALSRWRCCWRSACGNGNACPTPGTRRRVALIGLLMIGSYQICYLLALEQGITPGVLATLLGVQPILTQFITERRCSGLRGLGLLLAMAGLTLVVYQSLMIAHFSLLGMLCAFIALGCMTAGTLLQKGLTQPPLAVLPLQYAVGLLMCTLVLPFEPLRVDWGMAFILPLLWMAVVISVLATFLLYRLIQRGNLVQVTSLFYLIPAVTALLDYLLLGHTLAAISMLGMAAIRAWRDAGISSTLNSKSPPRQTGVRGNIKTEFRITRNHTPTAIPLPPAAAQAARCRWQR